MQKRHSHKTVTHTPAPFADRGVDFDSGRYFARVGDEYKTFWSSETRDQWYDDKKRKEAK